MSENQDLKLERIIGNQNNLAEIVFAYRIGSKPIAKELLINCKSYKEIGKSKKRQTH